MNLNSCQPPASSSLPAKQPSSLDYFRSSYREPWYFRYPLSSWLALILAAAVTVTLWTALIVLEKYAIAGGLVIDILAWLVSVVTVVTLFTIMWFFETGVLTSIMIGFVAWCHLGAISLAVLWSITGGEYDSPNFVLLPGLLCISFPVAVLFGAWVGSRHERPF